MTAGNLLVLSGDVLSNNGRNGVDINGTPGASNTVIQGNLIGTDISGEFGVENDSSGILIISDPDTTIGGTQLGQGNLISGNGADGVTIADDGEFTAGATRAQATP